jgi:2-polyprenyl-3-methyl-5-hydroxy-6-metoxy-1,4-benzoquinol methylase
VPESTLSCVACERSLDPRDWLHLSTVTLRRCSGCGSLTAVPRPTPEAQASLHDAAEYFSHPYFERRRTDEERTAARCLQVFDRLSLVLPATRLKGRRHLDVGCDTGAFLIASARLFGVIPVGLDVAAQAVDLARRQGLAAHHASLETAPATLGAFAIITAIDVIEHVADPRDFLTRVGNHLEADGACYIETPNAGSVIYALGRLAAMGGWRESSPILRLFPSEHIQYLSLPGLQRLAERSNLRIAAAGTRRLPYRDLGVPRALGAALSGLQVIDTLARTQILRWAILAKR